MSAKEEFKEWWTSLPAIAKKHACELSAESGWIACESLGAMHRKRMDGVAYDQDFYRDTMKAIYADLFREANITQSKIEAITCLDTLHKLKAIVTEMAEACGVVWH